MVHLPSLGDDADLAAFAAHFPEPYQHLAPFTRALMEGPSPFTLGERELLAAYVSALNACRFCHGVHAEVAKAHGIDADVLAAVAEDPASAPLDARWRALLAFVGKLNAAPAAVTADDVAALLAAGWSERAVVDAILVCATFNLYNRLVDGLGLVRDAAYWRQAGARIAARADPP